MKSAIRFFLGAFMSLICLCASDDPMNESKIGNSLAHYPGTTPKTFIFDEPKLQDQCCWGCPCIGMSKKQENDTEYGCLTILCCGLGGGFQFLFGETNFCRSATLCGILGCLVGKNDQALFCSPSVCCCSPLCSFGQACGIGWSFICLGCYVGADEQKITCCCVDSGNLAT